MIAQLPADKMPPPRPTGISRFERLFRVAANLDIDKADIKRHEEFVNHKLYDLLVCGEATARANGRRVIAPHDLPITTGLQQSIEAFREMDETIALQPILTYLAKRPPLDLAYGGETEAELSDIAGGLSVALARSFKLIDPDLKNPQARHWDRAFGIFNLLL
jgi:hypothetical protein